MGRRTASIGRALHDDSPKALFAFPTLKTIQHAIQRYSMGDEIRYRYASAGNQLDGIFRDAHFSGTG
jgi:hypothetical protein